MNQKTESGTSNAAPRGSEFHPGFIQGLVIITVATLILVFSFERYVQSQPTKLFVYAWVVAAGFTIEQGLSLFSGKMVQPLSFEQQVALLGGLWSIAVLGPTLFLFGWRQRRLEKTSDSASGSLRASTISYLLGGIITFTAALPVLPSAIIQRVVSQDMHNAQAIASNKDSIINELNWLALHAVQYRILPKELGGGSGSYAGYTIPTHLMTTDVASYSITEIAGETIRFTATSTHYPTSTVSATFGTDGRAVSGSWQYTGEFH
jgi:hypothetical protein